MKDKIENIEKSYNILKDYSGNNGYIKILKKSVSSNNNKLNDFQINFILKNFNFDSKFIGRNIKVAEWWGKKAKEKYELPFIPKLIEVGYYFGECDNLHVFYARFRKSQEKGVLIICPSSALITNFWVEDFNSLFVNFSKYNTDKRTLLPIQEEAIKFYENLLNKLIDEINQEKQNGTFDIEEFHRRKMKESTVENISSVGVPKVFRTMHKLKKNK